VDLAAIGQSQAARGASSGAGKNWHHARVRGIIAACRGRAADLKFEGALDICSDDLIAGWAWDRDEPEHRVEVEIIVDGGVLGCVKAESYRADLEAAGIGDGAHAFHYAPRISLCSASRSIVLRAAASGFELPRSIPAPQPSSERQDVLRSDQIAAKTWNRIEPLDLTNRRIHDGAVDLRARADDYVSLLFGNFAYAIPPAAAAVLEIGSGVGWIMEAINRFLSARARQPTKIVGLDIAPNMLAKARSRLGESAPYAWQLYDGVTIPLADGSLDLIYSVAALQHIPRPFVFNLFFEILRLLHARGFAILHFLSTDNLPRQEPLHPWRLEIDNQIRGEETHWHHFYTAKELSDVLSITGFRHIEIKDDGCGTLVACLSRQDRVVPVTG
jgi:SAM-dependent methyltransferase